MSLEWILILALFALVLYAFVAYQKLREEITGLRALDINNRKERIKLTRALAALQSENAALRNQITQLTPPAPTPPAVMPEFPKTALPVPFYNYFTWLEDEKGYQTYYKMIDDQYSQNGLCPFCGNPANMDVGKCLPLHSLVYVHQDCYQHARNWLQQATSVEMARQMFQQYPFPISCVYWVLAHWPDYPEDWDIRRQRILSRDGNKCQRCGKKEKLHIHHKSLIADGGLHTPSNLTCLCETCHHETHGSAHIPVAASNRISQFAEKMQLLKTAIQESKAVQFHYCDRQGRESDRTFTPTEWPDPAEYRGAVCIRGYCHSYNASRTFNVQRISQLKII